MQSITAQRFHRRRIPAAAHGTALQIGRPAKWRLLLLSLPVAAILVTLLAAASVVTPASAAFPGANGKIVYSNSGAIWTVNPDGSNPTQLTTPSVGSCNGGDFHPSWSPDGKKIVYTSGETNAEEVWIMDADGSNQTRLTTSTLLTNKCNLFGAKYASFTPDGTKIVYTTLYSGVNHWNLWMMDVDGSNKHELYASTTAEKIGPKVSPDGQTVVFTSLSSCGTNIFVGEIWKMDIDGSNAQLLIAPGCQSRYQGLSWSPDGTRIAFMVEGPDLPNGGYEVATVNADGTGYALLTSPADDDWSYRPAFSPDGTQIVFDNDISGVVVVDANATPPVIPANQTLIGAFSFALEIDWQPLVADLTVTKTHTGDFSKGQVGATYTIIVSNDGTAYTRTDSAVTVVDTLPDGLTATAIGGTGWNCTLATLTCVPDATLADGASYPAITLTVTVSGSAAASVTNTVTVSGGGDTITVNNTAEDVTSITGADLTITKSHTGNFLRGQVGATYLVTVSNSGTSASSGLVTVVDTLPDDLTATAISGTGWSCTLGTLTCTRSDALAGAADYPDITVTVDVSNTAASSVTNSVTVSGGGETNTANDTATDPTTIDYVDLTVVKTHTGNFTQGQAGATYTVTVTNSGTGSTVGLVSVVDTLPSGLTATGLAGTGWSCTLGTLTCTRSDTLAAAASYPGITVTVDVSNSAAASVTNNVAVSGGGEVNTANSTDADLTTIDYVDFAITKTHFGDFLRGQAGATYTVTVTNDGTASTTGLVTVVDTLPAGLTATGMSGTGWSCTLGTLTCTRSDALAAAASYPDITVTVDVSGTAPASVTNIVTVSGAGDTNGANDSASDLTTLKDVDLTITKTHTGNFRRGQVGAAYRITVRNVGTGWATGLITVEDNLPAGLTATAASGDGWTCTRTVANTVVTCTRTADALCITAPPLGFASICPGLTVPGSSQAAALEVYPVITVAVTVADSIAANIVNTATVSGGGDLNTANNAASDSTTITSADLAITKTHTGSFRRGQVGATYRITVKNVGPVATGGLVTVVDTLPAGLTATGISGTGWTCTLATVSCTRSSVLSPLAPYPFITVTVNVSATAASSVTNLATVSGGGDGNAANNTASDQAIVNAADLVVKKTHTGNFHLNQVGATYRITVKNIGVASTTGVVTVTDILPAGLTATAISGSGWTCTLATLTCTRGSALAPAGSYPFITVRVNVSGTAPPTVVNTATVSGGGEFNTTNDVATDPTTIIP